MQSHFEIREPMALSGYLLKWVALATPLGIIVGSACALFLASLDLATAWRVDHPWLLWLLPFAGLLIGWCYSSWGASVDSGHSLIFEEINEPNRNGGVPLRMAPMILVGTVVTHLFGGSAGREGTAVQMGGSLASGMARYIPGVDRSDVQTLLMAGIAAGFGGVFGTPVAGMIFSLEVLVVGRLNYAAILPCLIASAVSDGACAAWGVHHTHYHVASLIPADSPSHLAPFNFRLLMCVVLSGIVFGLVSRLFAELMHHAHWRMHRVIPSATLRPMVGGVLVVILVVLLGTRDYLGLGVASADPNAVTIVSSFREGGVHAWSWWWKLVFTVVTLASGFKGGEVTPLFFIGASLGNVLAGLTGAPVDVLAALGFLSVFAGATNTPIACTVMGVELFGGEFVLYYAVSCLLAYLFSGHSGIYLSQRIGTPKLSDSRLEPDMSLGEVRAAKRHVRR
ncbi:MAG: voltage-gated chloride channel family protein [Planctomycetota bacterium]|nr:voltage-gated chloride channel family protein [Planctomycetota bacterium]